MQEPDFIRLSVVAIVHNEERNLPDFLATHEFADEIVLVDSGSTDRTREIALAHPRVRFFENPWPGFPAQWNHGIDRATGEWILISEADHRASPELRREIETIVVTGGSGGGAARAAAYLIPRRNHLFGKWLRHGGCWPDYCYPRLFRRGTARFDESKRIHEKLQAPPPWGRLKGHFDHLSSRDLEQYMGKMTGYTDAEAATFVELVGAHGSRARAAAAICFGRDLPVRQRLSYLRPLLPCWPLASFFYRYILRLGFLDGRAGYRFAALSSFYEYLWRIKARELMEKRRAERR
jgi:glycosyltransferase involved in cell wall biosynthesis